eukprot:gene11518-13437_t
MAVLQGYLYKLGQKSLVKLYKKRCDSETTVNSGVSSYKPGNATVRELESELEAKENIIAKLQEEKLAFEQYAKEIEEEKVTLLVENEKMMDKILEQADIESFQHTINSLERQRQELASDLSTLSKELEEERSVRRQAIHDKNVLEKNFGLEKNDLIHRVEESEFEKKKVLQLFQSGAYTSPSVSQQQQQTVPVASTVPKVNWSQLLFMIEKDNFQDNYYLENIRLRKKVDEHQRIDKDGLARLDGHLATLRGLLEEYRCGVREIDGVVPVAVKEIGAILEFVESSQPVALTVDSDEMLAKFVETFDHQSLDQEMAETEVDQGNTSEAKARLVDPLTTLRSQISLCSSSNSQVDPEFDRVVVELDNLSSAVSKVVASIRSDRSGLVQVLVDAAALPYHPEGIDPFEAQIESVMLHIEPHVFNDDSGVSDALADPETLTASIATLRENIETRTIQITKERERSLAMMTLIESTEVGLEMQQDNFTTLGKSIDTLATVINSLATGKRSLLTTVQRLVVSLVALKKRANIIRGLSNVHATPYIANQSDQLDVLVESVIHSFQSTKTVSSGVIPPNFERLGEGLYQFGTRRINTSILAGNLVVRVGGGFMCFEEFVLKYGRAETIKMLRMPASGKGSFLQLRRSSTLDSSNSGNGSPDKRFTLHGGSPLSRSIKYT